MGRAREHASEAARQAAYRERRRGRRRASLTRLFSDTGLSAQVVAELVALAQAFGTVVAMRAAAIALHAQRDGHEAAQGQLGGGVSE
jgi:S-adenosylmethionine:diacylglycerol 3-amino-3-carboxypropyl transferase